MRNRSRGKFAKVVGPLERLDDRITPATIGGFNSFTSPFLNLTFTGGNAGSSLVGTTTPAGGVFGGTAFSGGAASFGGNTFGAQSALGGAFGTPFTTFTNANAGGHVFAFATTGNSLMTLGRSTNLIGSNLGSVVTPTPSFSFTPGQTTVLTGGSTTAGRTTGVVTTPTSTSLSFLSPFNNAGQFGFVNNATSAVSTSPATVSATPPGVGFNAVRFGFVSNGLPNNGQALSTNVGSTAAFGFTTTVNSPNRLGFDNAAGQFIGPTLSNSGIGAGGGVI